MRSRRCPAGLAVCSVQSLLPPLSDALDVTSEYLLGREERENVMVMLRVVPAEEVVAPAACVPEIAKASGIVRLVLQRVKVRFGKRIVVGDARSRVAALDAELAEQFGKSVTRHRRSPILVHGERSRSDAVALDGLTKQLLGQRAVLVAGLSSKPRRTG
jgi:hypothetical protein